MRRQDAYNGMARRGGLALAPIELSDDLVKSNPIVPGGSLKSKPTW